MEKAERIDTVRNSLDSEDELRRRLPEVDAIYDEEIREATIEYFLTYCPRYFWKEAASVSGNYHPEDERGEYGLWLHTKRVFFEYANLSESLLELHEITEHQREAGKAAALIHDTFHRGWPSGDVGTSCQEHDVIAAAMAKEAGLPGETIHLVHCHMGSWGSGKLPETRNEHCMHFADKSAAADNHKQAVYFPAKELQEEFPHLETVEVEDGEVV